MMTMQRNAPTSHYPNDHPPPASLAPHVVNPAHLAAFTAFATLRRAAHDLGMAVAWVAPACLVVLWVAVGWGWVEVECGLAAAGWCGATIADWTRDREVEA